MKTKLFVAAACVSLLTGGARASSINSPADPALVGDTVITFSTPAEDSYTTLQIDGVTFSGNGPLVVDSTYGGDYNTQGSYVQNNSGDTTSFTFQFAQPTSALGFNFGASDSTWTLQAYDASNTLLGTATLAPTYGSNAGDFFGLAAAGIDHATLSTPGSDYVLLDNFSYIAGAPVS